jgi:tRNA(Arg) A34 adenosine deaminase TadA
MEAEQLMRLAIDKVREGFAAGQSPFGCAIAIGDRVLAVEHNLVRLTTDITAHAEINALRTACRAAGDIHLAGAIVATTCEPCPMCMSALHWARVEAVYYGATIADATSAGFNELSISASELIRLGGSTVKLQGGLLSAECAALFQEWLAGDKAQPY